MIHSKPSDLPSYTVSSPFRRSHGHVPLDRDYRSLFKIHSKELNNFLGTHTAQGVLYTARKTLNSLTRAQLYEHSEDVCDEVLRRTSLRDLVSYLSARPEFHPKRNQARAKLSALLDDRLKDLISDVCLEIDRRYPTHFPKARLDNSHDRNAITIHQKVTPSLAEKAYVAGVQGKNDTIGNDFAVPTEMILKEYENKDVSSEALAEPLELQSHVALLPFTGRKTDKDDLMDSSTPSTSTIKRQSPLSPSSSDSYKNNSIPSVNESHRGLRKCLQTKEGCEKELAHLGVVLEDEQQRRKIVNKIGEDAQFWLDLLQSLVDYPGISQQLRTTMFTIMVHLSKKSGLYPECLMIHNVRKIGEHPVGGGGFGDVWEGVLDSSEGSPQKVCLKVIRVFRDSPMEQLLKGCLREAIVWRQLKHPNVLPFLGIYYLDDTHRRLSLVSPWMEKGNLMEFLQATPWKSVNHHLLASDVAAGLCYLHSMKIVHGDLKALNILITPHARACITDFGLSRVTDTVGIHFTTSTDRAMGTARWLSPELLQGGSFISKESDIYAYGCICYEIFTGLLPFHDVVNEMAVALQVLAGKRPSRPSGADSEIIDDLMWSLMAMCWSQEPTSRPTAEDVVERLTTMNTTFVPAPGWDGSIFTQIWYNVV